MPAHGGTKDSVRTRVMSTAVARELFAEPNG
jgi:hypothetical protein